MVSLGEIGSLTSAEKLTTPKYPEIRAGYICNAVRKPREALEAKYLKSDEPFQSGSLQTG